MTPQERQLIDDLFDRLSKVESAPRDPDAVAAIAQGLRMAPNAVYALVQTVLLQDEALKRANSRIQELEAASAPEQSQSGGFLDSMRDTMFGQSQSHGSVPNVRPPDPAAGRSGTAARCCSRRNRRDAMIRAAQYGQGPYGQQPYGAPQAPMGGGGGSFLGTAAAAAAGTVGGSLLLNSIRVDDGRRPARPSAIPALGDEPQPQPVERSVQQRAGARRRRQRYRLAGSRRADRARMLEQDREDDNSRSGLFDQASNDR